MLNGTTTGIENKPRTTLPSYGAFPFLKLWATGRRCKGRSLFGKSVVYGVSLSGGFDDYRDQFLCPSKKIEWRTYSERSVHSKKIVCPTFRHAHNNNLSERRR